MYDPRRGPEREDVAAASVIALPFALYVATLAFLAPASEANWAAADPILSLLPRELAVWSVPVASVCLAFAWWKVSRPSRRVLVRAGREAVLGVVVVALAVVALRVGHGAALPAFIPAEESAGPGYLLSMTAGLSEELACRLVVLPALLFALRGRMPNGLAAATSVVATALVFALWHAAGESDPSTTYFVTRFVMPGCIMSIVWLVSPSAIVAGHAAAHLLIPALFVSV